VSDWPADAVLRPLASEAGGVLTKLLAWLVVLAVAASGGLFVYVRSQEPLALGDATVRTNGVLKHVDAPDGADVAYRVGGEIYVATFVRNTGRLPVNLEGLAEPADNGSPYVAVSLQLGTGTDTDPSQAADFTSFRIDPGTSVGVLVTYRANPDLVCQAIPVDPGPAGVELDSFSVRFNSYGIERTQELKSDTPFVISAAADRADCQHANAR
jgi:hypothetical protein